MIEQQTWISRSRSGRGTICARWPKRKHGYKAMVPEATGDAVIDPLGDVMDGTRRHHAFDAAVLTHAGGLCEWRRQLGLFNRVGTNLVFHIVN